MVKITVEDLYMKVLRLLWRRKTAINNRFIYEFYILICSVFHQVVSVLHISFIPIKYVRYIYIYTYSNYLST